VHEAGIAYKKFRSRWDSLASNFTLYKDCVQITETVAICTCSETHLDDEFAFVAEAEISLRVDALDADTAR